MLTDPQGFEGISPAALAAWEAFRPAERPGPDWLRADELGRLWGTSTNAASHRANRLISTGQAERRAGFAPTGQRAYYYHLKEGADVRSR